MQYEIIDDIIKNATQPLYDKLTEIEKTLSALSRIATEHSESYPNDYQILSDFLTKEKS